MMRVLISWKICGKPGWWWKLVVEVRVVVVVSLDWSRQGCRYKLQICGDWRVERYYITFYLLICIAQKKKKKKKKDDTNKDFDVLELVAKSSEKKNTTVTLEQPLRALAHGQQRLGTDARILSCLRMDTSLHAMHGPWQRKYPMQQAT